MTNPFRGHPPLSATRPIHLTPTLRRRLVSRLCITPSGCWEWQGARTDAGYGVISAGKGNTLYAHRVSWTLHKGPIPHGLLVCHHCDNPPCCRPDHLFLGDPAINNADMRAKGRDTIPEPFRKGLHGEDNPRAKLTTNQVIEIRAKSAAGESSTALAHHYDVDSSTVRQIVRRVIWKKVGEA